MADGEYVDLDDLIEKDKKAHRLQRKTQIIHKPPRNNHRPRNTDNRRDNFHRRNDWQHKEDINDRDRGEKGYNKVSNNQEGVETSQGGKIVMYKKQGEIKPNIAARIQSKNEVQGYGLFITGFVSDVSIDDIFNLAQGKKLTSIRTTLKGKDGIIDGKTDTNMYVMMNFVEKDYADAFMREYSDKLLDGKHSLTFQFRRGY